MTRYDIVLGKTPPPCVEPKPPKKKAPKKKDKQGATPRIEQSPMDGRLSVPPDFTIQRHDQAVRESILSNYLRTANGRARLAASMINPLQHRVARVEEE
jgi:hypothetical protein